MVKTYETCDEESSYKTENPNYKRKEEKDFTLDEKRKMKRYRILAFVLALLPTVAVAISFREMRNNVLVFVTSLIAVLLVVYFFLYLKLVYPIYDEIIQSYFLNHKAEYEEKKRILKEKYAQEASALKQQAQEKAEMEKEQRLSRIIASALVGYDKIKQERNL